MRLYINGMIEVVCLIMVIFYLTCCTFLFFSFPSLSFPFSPLPPLSLRHQLLILGVKWRWVAYTNQIGLALFTRE